MREAGLRRRFLLPGADGNGHLYAIASDPEADSTLYQIVPGQTPSVTPILAPGQGYLNASLADVSPATAPEPSGMIPGVPGVAAILAAQTGFKMN